MGYKRVSEVDWEQLWDISSATRVLYNSGRVSSLSFCLQSEVKLERDKNCYLTDAIPQV